MGRAHDSAGLIEPSLEGVAEPVTRLAADGLGRCDMVAAGLGCTHGVVAHRAREGALGVAEEAHERPGRLLGRFRG